MNDNQYKRFKKLSSEPFYLLEYDQNFVFKISGSTKNIYTVSINAFSKTINCDCPDSISWAKKCNCVCKHCLFILYRVLKIYNTLDVPFFNTLHFNDSDMKLINTSFQLLPYHLDPNAINDDLVIKYKNLQSDNPIQNELVVIEPGDICGICFIDIEESNDIYVCQICKKVTHKVCINKWFDSGLKLCVYCRQQTKRTTDTNKYQNLN